MKRKRKEIHKSGKGKSWHILSSDHRDIWSFGNKLTKFLKILQTDAIDHHQLSESESQVWLHKAKCSIATALQLGNGRIFTRLMRKAFAKRKRTPREMEELLSRNIHSNVLDELLEPTAHDNNISNNNNTATTVTLEFTETNNNKNNTNIITGTTTRRRTNKHSRHQHVQQQ